MKARDFCYWLQGFFELGTVSNESINAGQAAIIKNHLALVFKHDIDPEAGDQKVQDALNALHNKPNQTKPGSPENILLRC